MILYGIERYFIEFLRDDPGRGEVFGGLMTGTQLISILLGHQRRLDLVVPERSSQANPGQSRI